MEDIKLKYKIFFFLKPVFEKWKSRIMVSIGCMWIASAIFGIIYGGNVFLHIFQIFIIFSFAVFVFLNLRHNNIQEEFRYKYMCDYLTDEEKKLKKIYDTYKSPLENIKFTWK